MITMFTNALALQ